MQSTLWIPNFTTVINWTLRFALALMKSTGIIEEPWIAIVDTSIDIACKKVLVVLRIPLSALQNRGSAITLADAECIGISVSETWTVNRFPMLSVTLLRKAAHQ